MKKTLILESIKSHRALCCGGRVALVLEKELPAGDTPLARHAHELAGVLFAHAEQAYLPAVSKELAELAQKGRGYEFSPHRLCFSVFLHRACARVRVELLLRYTVQGQTRFLQNACQLWSADGAFRLR